VLQAALTAVKNSIDKGVERGKTAVDVGQQAKEAITVTTAIAQAADADLVIEAAPEKIELKRQIFADLEKNAPPHTIFASNTSSLSINVLAAACKRQAQFVGLHFFNPAYLMKLVEVIKGDFT